MCYAYLVPPTRYDQLGDLLTRIHVARQRPHWNNSTLGALRAVEHSTASRIVAAVTDRRRDLVAGTVADWPESDVDTLVALLARLTERFESAATR